jgi:phosphohistidine phosphatase SixA
MREHAFRLSRSARLARLLGPSWLLSLCLVGLLPLLYDADAFAAPAQDEAHVVQALRRGGVAVLIRHSATEPGAGDPPGFRLSDCATQRNLNEAGRDQARRLGAWFEANAIRPATVRASPWCRARETALLAFGRVEDWNALSNLFSDGSRRQEQVGQVRAAIAAGRGADVDVFISHGVSINAFVDVYLQQGEMVVVRAAGPGADGGIEVVGRLLVP